MMRQTSRASTTRCVFITLGLTLLLNVGFSVQISAVKIDCHPLPGASEEKCRSLGCVWEPVKSDEQQSVGLPYNFDEMSYLLKGEIDPKPNIQEPWCHFPADYVGYKIIEKSPSHARLVRVKPSALGDDIEELLVELSEDSSLAGTSLVRVRIFDTKLKRFEPELPKLHLRKARLHRDSIEFSFAVDDDNHLRIRRKSSNAVVFDTDLTKLIYSDKFIQFNTKLDSPFLYGLGEHYDSFLKKADQWKAYSFYNTDKVPLPEGRRSYGTIPFYVNLDSEGNKNANGLFMLNSDAMDVIVQGDQSITFRTLGGIVDLFIFSGPKPLDVIKQYTNLVGNPQMPPRWALGYHLCRYNYGSLNRTKEVWARNKAAGIPFDVQWNDIDNMNRHNDFTYDHDKFHGLPEFIDELHELDMHYMILFDPGVSQEDNYYPYELGEEMDIFIKNATNQVLVAKVWNDSGRTVFPDFSDVKSHEYWSKLFTNFQREIAFDGAWIDMNDISNFVDGSIDGCPDDPIEQTPYKVGGYDLQRKSLCLSARHKAGTEYNLHNLFSFYEAIATSHALKVARPNKRPFVISRSTFPGQGHFGGHWSGDVLSTWDYLRWSIPSLIEYSMYGYSMMGSDICGFVGDTNEELCARWSTLGAFYTFTRNHNDDVSKDQDPAALGETVIKANVKALNKKYELLPFLYTLMHQAHKQGEPVIRSVPLEFNHDQEALKVEYQFLWGRGLMISPVVEENTHEKSSYLPAGRWYETNLRLDHPPTLIDSMGQWHGTSEVDLTELVLFYRGGHIIPTYPKPEHTVAKTVRQPFGLVVALCEKNYAYGEIVYDEGDNIDGVSNLVILEAKNNKLVVRLARDDHQSQIQFGSIKILGTHKVSKVEVAGKDIPFHVFQHILSFDLNEFTVSKGKDLVIRWTSD